jgi:hypothetical protein
MREQIDALSLALGDKLDIAYTIEENTGPEFRGIQLILRDLRRSAVAIGVS